MLWETPDSSANLLLRFLGVEPGAAHVATQVCQAWVRRKFATSRIRIAVLAWWDQVQVVRALDRPQLVATHREFECVSHLARALLGLPTQLLSGLWIHGHIQPLAAYRPVAFGLWPGARGYAALRMIIHAG